MKSKKKTVIFISILLIIFLSIGLFALIASYRISKIPTMSFEEMLSYTTQNNEDAMITVGIVRNGEVSFTVYGKNSSILPEKQLEYEIGSITKTFTTSLLSKTIYEENIELSDSIDQYIELPHKDYYPNLQSLATHTSGYKNYYFDWQMASNRLRGEKNDFYGISTDILNQKIGEVTIEKKDYSFNYSNFGISVVGSALAEVYEKDFTNIMNDFIESDLKLPNTTVSNEGNWNWMADDAYIPAGGIVSTISDMLRYLELHMLEELPYLSLGHEAHAEVNTTKKQYEQMGIRIDNVGLGWMIDAENNIIWHNGATSNFNSYMAFDKEKQIGVVILSNLSPNYRIPATVMGVKLMTSLQNDIY